MAELEKDRDALRVLDRMRMLCSRREYCTEDIRKKISMALSRNTPASEPFSDAACQDLTGKILGELKKDRYIDDLRYATAFARDKAAISGWGAVKIRYALAAKRIGNDVIDEALSCIDTGKASEKLEKILAGRYRSLKDDPAWRMKLIRYALGRGYVYDDIMAVLSTLHPSP